MWSSRHVLGKIQKILISLKPIALSPSTLEVKEVSVTNVQDWNINGQ